MKYLMGIDNGGTFSKVGIFDEEGNQIAVASVPTVTITPKPGYTERDLNDLWDVNAQAIRNAIEKSKVAPSDIVGVSFSGHGEGLYMVAEGTPVAAGMFDVNACGIASGLSDEEQMCMVAGTWSINEFIRKTPVTNGTVALNSMFCMPGYYLVEEISPTSAGNMEWFIRNLMSYEREEAKSQGGSIYDVTNKWVEEIEPQDNNIIFLPFLNGSNEDALAKGTFIGLTAYHNKHHMLRAVYEGIVFSHYTHVRKLLANREKPASVRLSGGAANSDVWVQIFADVLQIPIDVVGDKELGAQGAAMAAGIAAGIYQDYPDAIAKSVKITKTVQPRKEYAEIYVEKYANYRKVIESLNGAWECFKNN